MDIDKSSLPGYKSNKQDPLSSGRGAKSASETVRLKETASSSPASDIKSAEVKDGSVIKGEIIDRRFNEVTIKLEPSQQVIKAKLSGDVPLSIGQSARFQVTDSSSEQLVLRYVPEETSSASDSTIIKVLQASSLPATDSNRAIVEDLLNNRMSVDTQTLKYLIRLSLTNKEASPLTLVQMFRNQIPINAENIKQFEAYQAGTNQIINNLREIIKNISEINTGNSQSLDKAVNVQNPLPTDNVSGQPSLQTGTAPGQTLLQTVNVSGQSPQQAGTASGQTLLQTVNVSGQYPQQTVTVSGQKDAAGNLLNINKILLDILYQGAEHNSANISADAAMGRLLNKDELDKPTDGNMMLTDMQKLTAALNNMEEGTSFSAPAAEVINPNYLADIIKPKETAALSDILRAFPDSSAISENIKQGTAGLDDVINFIREKLPQASKEAAKALLESPVYEKLLTEAFRQKWTLTPDKLSDKDSVTQLYKKLEDDLEKLSALAKESQLGQEAQKLSEPVRNLQDNLRFMKDLNEVFTYLQLPVQLKGQDVHSELYVFTRKKALQDRKGSVSALLHLDMVSLGPLNIHISLEHNFIQASFSPADKEAGQLISDHLPELTEALKKKGYMLKSQVTEEYVKPEISNIFLDSGAQDNLVKRYTFDIRT